ncbi:MAG: hypothetical protein AAF577_07985 [Pseudomonadota bacterium]
MPDVTVMRQRRELHALFAALMLPMLAITLATAAAVTVAEGRTAGPDHFRIHGAIPLATLRHAPEQSAPLVARLPGGTDGIVNLGCAFTGDAEKGAREQSAFGEGAIGESNWCRVSHAGLEGWVRRSALREGAAPFNSGAGFDCTAIKTVTERLICQLPSLASLDREVGRLFRLAHDGLERRSEAARTLRWEQRAWMGWRDKCRQMGRMMQHCLRDTHVLRIGALRSAHEAARDPEGAASVGPFAFGCQGLEEAVHASFVAADRAAGHGGFMALRLDGEDFALARVQAPAGARFVANAHGLQFLVTGDSARLERSGDAPMVCKRL